VFITLVDKLLRIFIRLTYLEGIPVEVYCIQLLAVHVRLVLSNVSSDLQALKQTVADKYYARNRRDAVDEDTEKFSMQCTYNVHCLLLNVRQH
jgi:hypothetical protein